jgi:quinol monooxygenase YgiN
VKTGVQRIYNYSKTLDSGFRWNDGKRLFRTSYETIKSHILKICVYRRPNEKEEKMIYVIATVEVKPGKREDLLKRVRQLVPQVRAEKGCVDYGPAVDAPTAIKAQIPLGENFVVMVEKWEGIKELEAHLTAPHMLEYRQDVKDMVAGVKLQILQPA